MITREPAVPYMGRGINKPGRGLLVVVDEPKKTPRGSGNLRSDPAIIGRQIDDRGRCGAITLLE